MQLSVVEERIYTVLVELGIDPTSEHFIDTPARVSRALAEFVSGPDPTSVLKTGFDNARPGQTGAMVIQSNIPFRGLCPHHLVPFVGHAAVGYIPDRRIVGLSKLVRLVDACGTNGPKTQEEITNWVADTLQNTLDPKGVMVITKAIHMCIASRGVRAPDTSTTVSAVRGVFLTLAETRQEFLGLATW